MDTNLLGYKYECHHCDYKAKQNNHLEIHVDSSYLVIELLSLGSRNKIQH